MDRCRNLGCLLLFIYVAVGTVGGGVSVGSLVSVLVVLSCRILPTVVSASGCRLRSLSTDSMLLRCVCILFGNSVGLSVRCVVRRLLVERLVSWTGLFVRVVVSVMVVVMLWATVVTWIVGVS